MRSALKTLSLGACLLLAAGHASAGDVIAKGSFVGASDHVTTGGVHVTANSVNLLDDFSLDGAPDPKVGFGKDGVFDPDTTLDALQSNTGAQSYEVPDSVDPGAYNEVYIWCEQFSVPLGVAELQ